MSVTSLGRLLVVDDEIELLNSLADRLAQQGYETVRFSSPREAILALEKEPFDLLLTDLMMPEMDGITLLGAAQKIDPKIAGIVMTGQATVQTAIDAMKTGASDYVMKPFKISVLLPVLARALEVRRLRLENLQLRETLGIYELCNTVAFTLDYQTLLNKVIDAALQQCDADEGSIMLPTEKGNEMRIAVIRGEGRGHLIGERVPVGQSIASWVLRSCQPLTLSGEINDTRFTPVHPRPDIHSAVSMPMLVGGHLVGVLNLNCTSRRYDWTMGQVKALSILANTGAAALESARLHLAVQRAEQQYRSLVENAPGGILQSTPDGQVQIANPAAARMLGYSSTEELLREVTDLGKQVVRRAEDHAAFRDLLAEHGSVQDFELPLVRQDGGQIWASLSTHAVRDADGKPVRFESTVVDITRRKLAERRSVCEHSVAQILATTPSLTEAFPMILQTVGETLDWDWCALWQLDIPKAALVCQTVWHRGDADAVAFETYCRGLSFARGIGLPGRVWSSGQPRWVVDITSDADFPRATMAAKHAFRSALAFPLLVGKDVLGVVELLSRNLEKPDPQLLTTLSTIGNLLGQFIERRRIEEERDRFFNISLDMLCIAGFDGMFKLVNPAWETTLGWSTEELLTQPYTTFVHPDDLTRTVAEADRLQTTGFSTLSFENRYRCKDGSYCWLSWRAISDHNNRLIYASARDRTAQRHLEDQLRQAQKMEAFGQLAGGVAHDFNNLITIINGYSEFLLEDLPPTDPRRGCAAEIRGAGERAASLTAQLLTFSRKTIIEPKNIDLNELVAQVGKMLQRLIGEDITLTTELAPSLHWVMADQGQMEQVIMNLAVNARDAMPKGGRLTIATKNVEIRPDDRLVAAGRSPGPYVQLSVADTGTGMTETVKAKIFEPFFTTKGVGKGTGLGLATVYGIIQQAGGQIDVSTAIGVGTTFSILLPAVLDHATPPATFGPSSSIRGTETILLVEDELALRKFARLALEAQGYKVLEAEDGTTAIRIAGQQSDLIHLLVTDVVMPGMGGRDLAEVIRASLPAVRVIYMSGYTDDAIVRHGIVEATDAFLQKPFTPQGLARKVRATLDANP